ncbi:MAG: mercuric reductase [Chlamydiales bacterium]|nr:mercuric reductase [Chlamydiia bacterium]MCP5507031.1 mercuric reductase [Chlamydiales bacterium]
MSNNNYAIIVIGAGAAGLVVAIGAAKAGKNVLLIERGNYGGDCTNFGCIPSKAIIASAHAAFLIRHAADLGIVSQAQSNNSGALERARSIVSEVRSHEEPKELEELGVQTLTGNAAFVEPHTLEIMKSNGETVSVSGDQIVIATGSRPRIPNIIGIDNIPYLTNETVFELEQIPEHLGVIGGGPIGCELAQALSRLGSKVSLIHHHPHLLNKECAEAQTVIEKTFLSEGIDLYLNEEPQEISMNGKHIVLHLHQREVSVSHLLVSTGRLPNIEDLNLGAIGIKTNARGIVVDDHGRSSLPHVWAAGDVAGRAIFTHVAENEARTILKNLLVPRLLQSKRDLQQPIPRVTYTDPEVATVGMSENEARKKYTVATYYVPFTKVDRALTTGRTEGFVKIVTKKWSSKILGATIVAPRAGEMLMEVSSAMHFGIPLRKLAALIHPYPTYSLAIRKAADMWLTETILPSLKKLIGKSS